MNQNIKLLLIEDNEIDAIKIKNLLVNSKVYSPVAENNIVIVTSLKDALEYLTDNNIHIIITDLMLPDSEGIDTVFALKSVAPEIPVIVLTAVNSDDLGLQTLKAGVQDFLVKGQFDDKILMKSIYYALERHCLLMTIENLRINEAKISKERQEIIKKLEVEINGRKKIENELLNLTNELKTIIRALPDLYFKTTSDGIIIDFKSDNTEDLLVQPEIFLGKSFTEVLPDEVAKKLKNAYDNVKKTGLIETIEYSLELKNKGLQFYEARIVPLNDENNNLIVFVRNITERKNIIEKIIQSEKKYKELADSLPQVVFEANIDGKITFINKFSFKYFQYTNEEFNSINFFDLFDETSKIKIKNLIFNESLKLKTENLSNIELIAVKKDKTTFPVNLHLNFMDNDNQIIGIRGIIVDITEQKKYELMEKLREQQNKELLEKLVFERTSELIKTNEKLQLEINERQKIQNALYEREARYRALAENTYDLITEVDIDAKIIYVSPNVNEILGYNMFELINTCYYDYVHKDDLEKIKNFFKLGFVNKKGNEFSYRFKHKNGSYIIFESTGKIYQTANNQLRAVIVSRDITLKKQMENEIIKTSKLEALSILAGGIAHDFNNFLMGIIGNLNIAKKHITNPEKLSEVILRAEKVAYKAKNLTEQLVTFSKGGITIKKVISLKELITDTVQFALTGSNIVCELKFDDGLYLVEADEGQIAQVITNFVINAKQAMPNGGKLEVMAQNITLNDDKFSNYNGDYVKIIIKDTGVGISEENLSKIFDPYFTTKSTGSGLGLATSYSIIKNHNGFITVDSKLNVGTTFEIYLPALKGELNLETLTSKLNVNKKNISILLMDDDESILIPIAEVLIDLGYNVSTAKCGEEAIELYINALQNNKPFDVVIFDLVIPNGMGGKETLEKLRQINPNIIAIVSSGYSNDPIMANYLNYGFKGVLTKPYKIDEIDELIKKILNNEKLVKFSD